jgi:3-oxoacyl-[acyl-carrier-protein] synthase-3
VKPLDVEIISTGSYFPEKVITNAHLAQHFNIPEDEIFRKTGIKERRIAKEEEVPSDLGARACEIALKRAGLPPEDIDIIICGTSLPDYIYPSTACQIQKKINCKNAGAIDVLAGCCGFMYAFAFGIQCVATGFAKYALCVGAETISKMMSPDDLGARMIFGDGAGAAILRPSQQGGKVYYISLGADGWKDNIAILLGGGAKNPCSYETVTKGMQYLIQKTRPLYEFNIVKFEQILNNVFKNTNTTLDDIKLIIPHQPSIRLIQKIAEKLKIPAEKLYMHVENVGHTSSAAVSSALDKAIIEGRIAKGDLFLIIGMGAGMTWGSALLRL